ARGVAAAATAAPANHRHRSRNYLRQRHQQIPPVLFRCLWTDKRLSAIQRLRALFSRGTGEPASAAETSTDRSQELDSEQLARRSRLRDRQRSRNATLRSGPWRVARHRSKEFAWSGILPSP